VVLEIGVVAGVGVWIGVGEVGFSVVGEVVVPADEEAEDIAEDIAEEVAVYE
jgi:hypothetical protein